MNVNLFYQLSKNSKLKQIVLFPYIVCYIYLSMSHNYDPPPKYFSFYGYIMSDIASQMFVKCLAFVIFKSLFFQKNSAKVVLL